MHGALRIDRHLFARQLAKASGEGAVGCNRHGVAQMGAQFRGNLVLGDEQFGRAVGVGDHEGQGDRGAIHIGAANVEQPGNAIQGRNNRRIQPLGGEPFSHLAALGLA